MEQRIKLCLEKSPERGAVYLTTALPPGAVSVDDIVTFDADPEPWKVLEVARSR